MRIKIEVYVCTILILLCAVLLCITYNLSNRRLNQMEILPPPIPNQFMTDDGRIIHCKIVTSGTWNMDTTNVINVPHGLGSLYNNIIGLGICITTGAGLTVDVLPSGGDGADPNLFDAGVVSFDSNNIGIFRRTNGYYDNATFNNSKVRLSIWYFS